MSFTVGFYIKFKTRLQTFTLDEILTLVLWCIGKIDGYKVAMERRMYLHLENIWLCVSDPMQWFDGSDLTILNVAWVHFHLHDYMDNPCPDIILTITTREATRCERGQKVTVH